MKKNYAVIVRFLLPLYLLLGSVLAAQQKESFIISFPQGPPAVSTVCGQSNDLQITLSALTGGAAAADVTVTLAPGVEYVRGSAQIISASKGVAIKENGGTNAIPKFSIVKNNAINQGENIVFKISRAANCAAIAHLNGGGKFNDQVSAKLGTNESSYGTTAEYNVRSAVLTFVQPETQNNAALNTDYKRTFEVTNGGNGCVSNLELTVQHPGNGIQTKRISIIARNGVALVTPIVLEPVSSGTNTAKYAITSSMLPNGNFCNGDKLTFSEDYRILTCNAQTNYSVTWGCGITASCQAATGTGSVSMAEGTPDASFSASRGNDFVDSCTPYTWNITIKNTGSGDPVAAGMYNAKIRLGGQNSSALGTFDFFRHQLIKAEINGKEVPIINGTKQAIAEIDLRNFFTEDPDGPGGLEDLDGDGFYDDLRAGSSVNIKITIKENCSANVCNTEFSNTVYGVHADLNYTTPCSPEVQTTKKLTALPGSWTPSGTRVAQVTNTSYSPANIYDGVPFNARFSVGYYAITNKLDTNNTRYAYEITLPEGVSVSATPNAKWFNGSYPGTALQTSPGISQVGNVLTVISPSNRVGYITLDLVYNCGAKPGGILNLPFKLKRLDNIVTGCSCNEDIFCSTLVVENAVCAGSCANGPSLISATVERADNSLGWTNISMTTVQSRDKISAYDLSKALYLDDIEVKANGKQNGNSANLFLKFVVKKHASNENPLTPKSLKAIVKRGTQTFEKTVTEFTTNNVNSKAAQEITWNFSSLITTLPGAQLLDGDVIETVATYQVSSSNLPKQDMQTSEKLYFYNLDSNNVEVSCNYLIPPMYLLTGEVAHGANGGVYAAATACNTLMTHPSFLAYRFNSSGVKYANEIRPGFLPTQYEVTIPPGFTLDKITYINYDAGTPAQDITSFLVKNGSTYTYQIPKAVHNVLVTNSYNLNFHVYIRPACGVASAQHMNVKFRYLPNYYHHARRGTTPAEVLNQKNYQVTYDPTTKPTIELINLSGDVQAYKPIENHRFRIVSTGTTTAPYVWFSIPNHPNVTVKKVTDLASNAVMTGIPYAGGVWYQVSAAGLASSEYRDFQVDYEYNSCNATTFVVNAGWNCSAYPDDPTAYGCSASTVGLQFIPQTSVIQLAKVAGPPANVNMCDVLDYQYTYISAGPGNTSESKVVLTLPLGASFVTGRIQGEYPKGSGNWQPLVFSASAGNTVIDLSSHPAYVAAVGFPGTLSDGGNADLRQMDIRFQVTSNCTFISKSAVKIAIYGSSSCGTISAGNENTVFTDPINIIGTDTDYVVRTRVNSPVTLFDNCTNAVMLDLTHTVISGAQATGTGGEILINLPVGYDYAGLVCSGTFCPGFVETFTDTNTNQKVLRLSLPANMESGDFTQYGINLTANGNTISCGAQSVFIDTVDKNSAVVCSSTGIACNSTLISTGSYNFNYTVSKPAYAVEQLTGKFSGTQYNGNITVRNTSSQTSGKAVVIDFYCTDAAGNATGQLLGSHTLAAPLNAGSVVSENFSFTAMACSATGRVVASVRAVNNCVCTDSPPSTLLCYKDGKVSGAPLATPYGITTLGRAGADAQNWPMVRKGAWMALESNNSGFVINRLTDLQIANIPAANLVAGMAVYNTTQECLMINSDGTAAGWKCYNNQACPD